jgi:hypothetical protein
MHRMSFPVIHEMLGEYSPAFYTLRAQLFSAGDGASLKALEALLQEQAEQLAEQECRKLRLLIARRWKLVA